MEKRFTFLLERVIKKQANKVENEEFFQLINSGKYDTLLHKLMEEVYKERDCGETITWYLPDADKRMLNRIFKANPQSYTIKKPGIIRLWPRLAVAMALVVMLFGAYLFKTNPVKIKPKITQRADVILPGRNIAFLTLSNGKKATLSEAKKSVFIKASEIVYEDGTSISSLLQRKPHTQTENLLSMSTPLGGTYQVILSDGSKVWLNAGSTLKFPATFSHLLNRKVELNGEAYFEVSENKAKPFIVKTQNQEVKVLGTHFNINCYADEIDTKTTLLAGSVKIIPSTPSGIRAGKQNGIIKPGQQAIFNGSSFQIKNVNAEDVVDWKNGEFIFKDENIKSILRKISRWYNIKIIYNQNKSFNVQLYGYISRSNNLLDILSLLERTGKVHFKIEGKKVIVE